MGLHTQHIQQHPWCSWSIRFGSLLAITDNYLIEIQPDFQDSIAFRQSSWHQQLILKKPWNSVTQKFICIFSHWSSHLLLPLTQCWSPHVPKRGFSPELLRKVILSCFVFCCASQPYVTSLGFLLKYIKKTSGISGRSLQMLFPLKWCCFPRLVSERPCDAHLT